MPAPAGLKVLLTRGEEDCRAWASQLADHGVESVSLPCITTERIDTPALRAAAARAIEESDWLVFTSHRGVEAFADLAGGGRPARLPRIAVVGPATAEAARARFGRVDLVPTGADPSGSSKLEPGTAAALAATLVRELRGARPLVTLALAENAPPLLARALEAAGARSPRLDVYRTVPAPPSVHRRALSSLGTDNIFLASPSAVTGLVNQVEIDIPAALYAIGPSTAARMRALGLRVAGEAREPSLEGLLEILQCRN